MNQGARVCVCVWTAARRGQWVRKIELDYCVMSEKAEGCTYPGSSASLRAVARDAVRHSDPERCGRDGLNPNTGTAAHPVSACRCCCHMHTSICFRICICICMCVCVCVCARNTVQLKKPHFWASCGPVLHCNWWSACE
jgi:hypothetical protein